MLADLMAYLRLPDEVTAGERRHIERLNRVAMGFFLCNIPVFMLVAWVHDTGPMMALGLSLFTLAGPAIAMKALDARTASHVIAFTSMCMGGLLVHFAQGPVQIEMHFYFFVLLALLSSYGNPLVVVTAAVTVTVHHLTLWAFLPSSVFNYDAAFWVVGVHAIFVVVESVAAVFIARSFFDNVIGLEKIVAQRTAQLDARNQDMKLVLDNVRQGLLTVDFEGCVRGERSKVLASWFGEVDSGTALWDWIAEADDHYSTWLEMGWSELEDAFLPLELLLDQLPDRISLEDGTHLSVSYQPLDAVEDRFQKMLVVLTDITDAVHAEQAEAEQHQLVQLVQRMVQDRQGFLEFFTDAASMTDSLTHNEVPLVLAKRMVHTLKGNAGMYGLTVLASACHRLEDRIDDTGEPLSPDEKATLARVWEVVANDVSRIMGERHSEVVELEDADYQDILEAVARGESHETLRQRIASWKLEPTAKRLQRVADQARSLANRLGKGDLDVQLEAGDLRLDSENWSQFWAAFVHALRNAVDHGIEGPTERRERGKPVHGTLTLRTLLQEGHFVVELSDDGAGIDWQTVAEKAASKGLPHSTHDDLVDALFADGLSTREEVSETSGRGVGMAALRQACLELDGRVEVDSERGAGTTFRFVFPPDNMAPDLAACA